MASHLYNHGAVSVTFVKEELVQSIEHNGVPVVQAFLSSLKSGTELKPDGLHLPAETVSMMHDLLDAVSSLPIEDKERRIRMADTLFNAFFNVIGLARDGNPLRDLYFMRAVIQVVWDWEKNHETVHKGSAYYWAALSLLKSGDILNAYPYIFSAAEEDRINIPRKVGDYRESPANRTISLSSNPKNALFDVVVRPLRNFLDSRIQQYQIRTGGGLDLQGMDERFLTVHKKPLADIRKFFVATLHELYHIESVNVQQLTNNDYVKLKRMDMLFNLSLIADQVLEYRFLKHTRRKDRNMAKAVFKVAVAQGWASFNPKARVGNQVKKFIRKIVPHPNDTQPAMFIPALLDGSATYDTSPVNESQKCIFLAYHIRNKAAHSIEAQDVLVDRYSDILDNLMNAIFLSIEAL